jgi:hypothetical protein
MALQKVDEKEFGSSTGAKVLPIYVVEIAFPEHDWRRSFEVAGCELAESIEFLLGREFLRLGHLTYDGSGDSWSFEF